MSVSLMSVRLNTIGVLTLLIIVPFISGLQIGEQNQDHRELTIDSQPLKTSPQHTTINPKNLRLSLSSFPDSQIIYHGLNVVMKTPPYLANLNDDDWLLMREMGINSIRLGVMWEGVEGGRSQRVDYQQQARQADQTDNQKQILQGINQIPQRPQTSSVNLYLQKVLSLITAAGQHGISTLVQFHQDLISARFCADGAPHNLIPASLVKTFPQPIDKPYKLTADGLPIGCEKHAWGSYYLSFAVNEVFQGLYKNRHNKLRDKFVSYWREVVTALKDSPYVIAYELINEPWPGNVYTDPLALVPGLSQRVNLQQFYDLLSQQLRVIDPHHSLCFQPVTWLNIFPAGFTHAPGGRHNANHSIFCYHYYAPPTFTNFSLFQDARHRDANRLQTGQMLTQFYVLAGQVKDQDVRMVLDVCEKKRVSWFGWLYEGELWWWGVKGVERRGDINLKGQMLGKVATGNQIGDQVVQLYRYFMIIIVFCLSQFI